MKTGLLCLLFLFVHTSFALADDIVRIPEKGNSVTGYIGCEPNVSSCESSDVKTESIPAFYIQMHEVTVGEYLTCIDQKKCKAPADSYILDDLKTMASNMPATLPYDEAAAYCEAQGMRLPAMQQYLAAAMGESVQRYTWGDTYVETSAAPGLAVLIGKSKLSEVMQFPKDQNSGVYDLCGNACEWVESELDGAYSPDSGYKCGPDSRTRVCLGASPVPLYQQIRLIHTDRVPFRCVREL